MIKLAYSYACLGVAIIVFPAAIITLKKLYEGSKSHFAYILISFTFAYAVNKFAVFI
jgi:hypothetical protein